MSRMYYQYFGLNEAPFSIAVNPRYLFMSSRHRDALAHLLYGVGSGGGFILLTGEVGTGKTTINRCLLEQLPDNTDVAIILNPTLNALELLASVCDELEIAYDPQAHSLKTLTDQLHTFLLENHARGRNTVVMIDEAQHLDFEVLEQIRLLTNLETNNQKLLQIILIGQPELAQLLSRPELRQLNQRITARYNLEALNLDETRAYIRHRLSVAGLAADRVIFPDAVVRDLYRRTRGIPRLINVLCDRVLLGTYGQNKLRADRRILQTAAREVMGERVAVSGRRTPVALLVMLLLGLGMGAVLISGRMNGLDWGAVAQLAAAPEPAVSLDAAATPRAAGEVEQQQRPQREESVAAPWLLPQRQAMSALWALVSANPMPAKLCSARVVTGLACLQGEAKTWEALQAFDRPIVLEMVTPQRFSASVLLLGIRGRWAQVLAGETVVEVELADLGPLWTGTYKILWQPPTGFASPLSLGDEGLAVTEVALLFARLDAQQVPLASTQFNAALKQRVVLFQRQYALEDDGVIGVKTLLKLNELLGIDVSNARAIQDLAVNNIEAGAP